MRGDLLFAAVAAVMLTFVSALPAAAQTAVDLQLVLAVDASGSVDQVRVFTYTGTFDPSDFLIGTTVPEPSSFVLFGLAGGGLAVALAAGVVVLAAGADAHAGALGGGLIEFLFTGKAEPSMRQAALSPRIQATRPQLGPAASRFGT